MFEEKRTMTQHNGKTTHENNRKGFSIPVEVEHFYMTFIEYMKPYFKIRALNDIRVLAYMCNCAEYNTGVVKFTSGERKRMSGELSIKSPNISRCMKNLRDLGLISGGDSEYVINPQVFWKGTTDKRKEILETEGYMIKFNFIAKT